MENMPHAQDIGFEVKCLKETKQFVVYVAPY